MSEHRVPLHPYMRIVSRLGCPVADLGQFAFSEDDRLGSTLGHEAAMGTGFSTLPQGMALTALDQLRQRGLAARLVRGIIGPLGVERPLDWVFEQPCLNTAPDGQSG